jgi:N-acetylneuraminate synthase
MIAFPPVRRPVFTIAEIGINHNGSLDLALKLIDGAVEAGADAVKFQKRDPDVCVPEHQKPVMRETPWGTMTYLEYKHRMEFGEAEFDVIDAYCRERGIAWFASAWDVGSQHFLRKYDLAYNKIASAMLTHMELLEAVAEEGKYTFISTGMSTLEEVDAAVAVFRRHNCPFEVVHCNSSYPAASEDLNLRVIETLRERYNCDVGYSGHEFGLTPSYIAVALGATSVERHITLDRSMWGTDQKASVEVEAFKKLVRQIRSVEASLGDGIKRVTEAEKPIRKKLRGDECATALTLTA